MPNANAIKTVGVDLAANRHRHPKYENVIMGS